MAQIFHPSMNSIAKASLVVFVLAGVGSLWIGLFIQKTPYATAVGVALSQPVPFSHQHHVRELGIDCRYCHTSVEEEAFAGIPSTETCMQCHSQIWSDSEMLEPVRESYETGEPLQWNRVHDLPDYTYFNHSIHVQKGIGCVTCHGPMDEMPLTWKVETLHMGWCLECHREPERFVRPKEHVFDLHWEPEGDQLTLGRELVDVYNIQKEGLTNCSVCHR